MFSVTQLNFRNNFYHAPKFPHNCVPGSSKSRVSTAPIIGMHMDNVPSSSSLLTFNKSGPSGFINREIMDAGSYNNSLTTSGFRSQSLGQISQSQIIQPRFQPRFHLQQHSTTPSFLHLSQQKLSSSGIQDIHQQHPLYQQLHRHHLNLRCGGLIGAIDGEEDSEQEGIIMAVAAAGVGNNSGESGEELMHVDESNNRNERVKILNNHSLLVSNVSTLSSSAPTTVSITTPVIELLQNGQESSAKCSSNNCEEINDDLKNKVPI